MKEFISMTASYRQLQSISNNEDKGEDNSSELWGSRVLGMMLKTSHLFRFVGFWGSC